MVLSGSMEPKYPTGSILYVKDVDPFTLKKDDVITYMLGNEKTRDPEDYILATHRIIEVIPDPEDPSVIRFRTKGDNNDIADEVPVHCQNVVGTPVFHIPYLGFVANYIQNPPGMYIAIAAGAVLILMCFLPDLLSEGDPKPAKGKKKKDGEEEAAEQPDLGIEAEPLPETETEAEPEAEAEAEAEAEQGEDTTQG